MGAFGLQDCGTRRLGAGSPVPGQILEGCSTSESVRIVSEDIPRTVLHDRVFQRSFGYRTAIAGAMRAEPIPRVGLPRRNRTFPLSTVPDSAQPSINLSPTNRVNVQ